MSKFKSKFFKKWLNVLKEKQNIILKYKFLAKVERDHKDEKLSIYDTKIKTRNGDIVNRAIILEPASVVIVPVLKIGKTKKFILIKQFRICQGSEVLEFPAGSADKETLIKSAISEVQEELNLILKKKDLKYLYPKPIMMSPSYSNSLAYYFYFEKKVNKKFIKEINNKETGIKKHGEKIKTKVLSYRDVKNISTSSVVIGLALYNKKKK